MNDPKTPDEGLVSRVRRLAHARLAEQAEERWEQRLLAAAIVFSWLVSGFTFAAFRLLSGESLAYFAATWISGAVTLAVLGRLRSQAEEDGMSGLRQEVEVIPRTGVAVSAGIAFLMALLWFIVARDAPVGWRTGLAAILGLFIFLYGYLVAYVYDDARRRGMRPGAWALVAALVPNALGFVAYFLLRDPARRPCTGCGATSRRDLAFCPQCGSPLVPGLPPSRRGVPAPLRPLRGAPHGGGALTG